MNDKDTLHKSGNTTSGQGPCDSGGIFRQD